MMMKKLLLFILLVVSGVSLFAQVKVSGTVTYDNVAMTYIDSVTVILKQDAIVISQTSTDSLGYFKFDSVPNGTYTITEICNKHWGGGNSTDSYLVLKHFLHINILTGVKALAANVKGYGFPNSLDALMISQRFTHLINSFPAGDWVVEPQTITVSSAPVTLNMQASCRGDIDASFDPPATFVCGGPLVDSRDGQSYATVLINGKCWMAQNLNIGSFVYGVGDQTDNGIIERYCFSNLISNCDQFGGLYQWKEMMNYDTIEGGQGICPAGWHIPADYEWDTLINQFGGPGLAGLPLQPSGSSGFNLLMGGWVYNCSKFRFLYWNGYFWSSTSYFSFYGWGRSFTYLYPNLTHVYKSKRDGMSVRCLKNY